MKTTNILRTVKLVSVAMAVMASFLVIQFGIGSVGAYSGTNSLAASATVSNVCYFSTNTGSIAFGSIAAGSNVNTNVGVNAVDSGGNAASNIIVTGNTFWTTTTAGSSNTFGITNTLFDWHSDGAYNGQQITNTLVTSNIVIPAPNQINPITQNVVYFGLGIPGGTLGASYTTTITLETSC